MRRTCQPPPSTLRRRDDRQPQQRERRKQQGTHPHGCISHLRAVGHGESPGQVLRVAQPPHENRTSTRSRTDAPIPLVTKPQVRVTGAHPAHLPSGHPAAGIVAFTVSSARPDLGHPHAVHQPTCGAGSGSRRGHDRHCARRASILSAGSGPSSARLASARSQEAACARSPGPPSGGTSGARSGHGEGTSSPRSSTSKHRRRSSPPWT